MIDKVFAYDALVMVLELVADMYHQLAYFTKEVKFELESVDLQEDLSFAIKKAQEYFQLALETSTNNLKNWDPIKIKLVINMCSMFYDVIEDRANAIKMACEYYSFIPREHLNQDIMVEFKQKIKMWQFERKTINLDNSYVTDSNT